MELNKFKDFDKSMAKKFGDKFTGFGKADLFEPVQRIPIDCLSLNKIMGGGLPVGRLIEIFGSNSVGKSALATHFVASYQSQNKNCMWIDAEHTLDPQFMQYCGVDLQKLCKVAPDTAEESLEAMRLGMKMKDEEDEPVLDLIVLDSVAALTPSADFDEKNELGTGAVGKLARLMSNALKQIVTLAANTNTTILLINQERASNLMGYGPKSTTTGGNALKYYCSMRLDMSRTSWIEEGKTKIGQEVTIETVKNKTATPFRKTSIELRYPHKRNGEMFAGLDVLSDVVNTALDLDIIQQGGAWFTWGDIKVQGISKLKTHFISNEESYNTLYNQVENYNDNSEEDNKEA